MNNKEKDSVAGDGCKGDNDESIVEVEIISVVANENNATNNGNDTRAGAGVAGISSPIVIDSEEDDSSSSQYADADIDADTNDETKSMKQQCNLNYGVKYLKKTGPLHQPLSQQQTQAVTAINFPSPNNVANTHTANHASSSSSSHKPRPSSSMSSSSSLKEERSCPQQKLHSINDRNEETSSLKNTEILPIHGGTIPSSNRTNAVTMAGHLKVNANPLNNIRSDSGRETIVNFNQLQKSTPGNSKDSSSYPEIPNLQLKDRPSVSKTPILVAITKSTIHPQINHITSPSPPVATSTSISMTNTQCTDEPSILMKIPPILVPKVVDDTKTAKYLPPSSSFSANPVLQMNISQNLFKATGSEVKSSNHNLPIVSGQNNENSNGSATIIALPTRHQPIIQITPTTSITGKSQLSTMMPQANTNNSSTITATTTTAPNQLQPSSTATDTTPIIPPPFNKYSPFMQTSDSSISSALQRLRTALEQTRVLREAFTNRVYEKYRVVLRPVPLHITPVIDSIKSSPKASYARYLHQMDAIKTEKDAEKKEAQKLNQDLATVNTVAETGALMGGLAGVENADQLSWFNAGLGLVILPEEEVEDTELERRGIKFRGPIHPGTGNRVGGISAAAAAAACVMLDRVRKGNALRIERKRKRQLGNGVGDEGVLQNEVKKACVSNFPFRAVSSFPAQNELSKRPAVGKTNKQMKKGGSIGNESSQQVNSSGGKVMKAKPLPSAANLLSLLPGAEGIGLHGKLSAAGSALASQIGSCLPCRNNGKSVSNHHQRFRHPFPLSKAARSSAFGSTSHGHQRKLGPLQQGTQESFGRPATFDSRSLALPPILTPRERLRQDPVRVKDDKNFNEHTINAVSSVLEHFSTQKEFDKTEDSIEGKSKKHGETCRKTNIATNIGKSKVVASNRTRARNLKRHITEISLFKNIRGRQSKVDAIAPSPQLKAAANTRLLQSQTDAGFDQLLALSVLRSLGLVSDTSAGNRENRQTGGTCASENDTSDQFLTNKDVAGMSSVFTTEPLSKLMFSNNEDCATNNIRTMEKDTSVLNIPHTETIHKSVTNGMEGHDNLDRENNDIHILKTNNLKVQPNTSSYILSLRGGGQSDSNSNSKKMKKRTEMQNNMSDMSIARSNCRPESPCISSTMSSLLNNGVSPFVGTASHTGHALSMSRSPPAAQSPSSHASRMAQHQQIRASNDLLQVMWGEQNRADLALLQSHGASPIIPHHVASSLDSAYALIAQGDTLPSSLFSTQANQSSSNGIAAAISANARIQGQQQQHSLSRPLGGAHEQYRQHSNSSHQLRFVQNSLQNATAALNSTPIIHHSNAEMDYLQAAYGSGRGTEWSALGVHSLLPSHPSLNPSAIGLTPHQAAMVGLTTRERLILTTEHMQQLAHHNASVVANGSGGLSSLPTQQQQQGGFIDTQTRRPTSAGQISRAVAASGTHSSQMARTAARARQQQAKNVAAANSKSTRLLDQSIAILESDGEIQKRPASASALASASASDWRSLCLVPSPVVPKRPASADSRLLSLPAYRRTTFSPSKYSNGSKGKVATSPLHKTKDLRNSSNSNRDVKSDDLGKSTPLPPKIKGKPCVKKSITSLDIPPKSADKESGIIKVSKGIPVQHSDIPAQNAVDCSIVSEKNNNTGGDISVKTKKKVCEKEYISPTPSFMPSTAGLRFYVPSRPERISEEEADQIRCGFFFQVTVVGFDESMLNEGPINCSKNHVLLEYLMAVGVAVPIPKALVANPLKERLNSLSYRSIITGPGNNIGSTAFLRDVISAVINTWLWAKHQKAFEKAFTKSGRIDVDPHCKWLINATIESSLRVLSSQGLDLKSSAAFGKIRYPVANGNGTSSQPATIAVGIASLISQKLMHSFCVNEKMDYVIPNFNSLVSYLDKQRMSALRARSQERVLLAALVSRRTRMSEPFSHAYTSSMIRAGEALGYENLCDIVQDETTMTSTLLPFDILSDSTGAWEDPCRGFFTGQSADELSKRAHSRAIIQKSLKRLQDRHGIKGGTPNVGSYIDSRQNESDASKGGSLGSDNTILSPAKSSPTARMKRKSSFSGSTDISGLPHGLSSAAATALFNPNHYSSPFVWDTGDTENMPYGRHENNEKRMLSASESRLSLLHGSMKSKKARLDCSLPPTVTNSVNIVQSTHEIKWADVASMFRPATLGNAYERSLSNSKVAARVHVSPSVINTSAIFAPFCREIGVRLLEESDDESDSIEDLSDEKMLDSHQKVLDSMKVKFDDMMNVRKESQDRSRQKSGSGR